MFKFAQVMEEEGMADNLFTYNLHMVVCRLRKQEKAHGSTVKDLEFRVERQMQAFKTRLGRRVCTNPEKISANAYLIEGGVALMMKNTVTPFRSYPVTADTPSVFFGSSLLFLGIGRQMNKQGEEANETICALKRLLKDYQRDEHFVTNYGAWTDAILDKAFANRSKNVLVYKRAEVAILRFHVDVTAVEDGRMWKIKVAGDDNVDLGPAAGPSASDSPSPAACLPPLTKTGKAAAKKERDLVARALKAAEKARAEKEREQFYAILPNTIHSKVVVAYPDGEDRTGEIFALLQHVTTSR
eukprot:gene9242-16392_t